LRREPENTPRSWKARARRRARTAFVLMVLTMILIRTATVFARGHAAGADLKLGESTLLRRLART
jgi:hypothetical protein